MKLSAHDYLNQFKDKIELLEELIKKFIPCEKISDFKVIKDKYIIGKKYKITCLITFKTGFPKTLVIEIHDDPFYFVRNSFALTKLKEIKISNQSLVAQCYGIHKTKKIILREDIFCKTKPLQLSDIDVIAEWLAKLHSLPAAGLPKEILCGKNLYFEKKILSKIFEFIKPNVEHLTEAIKKNLFILLDKMSKEKLSCLVHGDFQPANIIINDFPKILDFDTLEIGNPGRDLGRFLAQINFTFGEKEAAAFNKRFLDQYYAKSRFTQRQLSENIKIHRAEMIQYILLGSMWDKKIPNESRVEKLLQEQASLF